MKSKIYSNMEIAKLLKDYVIIFDNMIHNPQIPFHYVAEQYFKEENIKEEFFGEHYLEMVSIFRVFLASKQLMFLKDGIFDGIKEDDLTNINFPSTIFINPDDEKRFSKKQIIKFIRNAFAHNYEQRELYQIKNVNNEIQVEINLLNTNPVPFHVVLNVEQIVEISKLFIKSKKMNAVILKTKQPINLIENDVRKEVLNKMFFRVYRTNMENSQTLIKEIKNDKSKQKPFINQLESTVDFKDYQYTIGQAAKIEEGVGFCNIFQLNPYDYIDQICKSTIHICQPDSFILTQYLFEKYFIHPDSTNENVIGALLNNVNKQNKTNSWEEVNKKALLSCLILSHDFYNQIHSIYYQYMFANVIKEKEITIGNNKYLVEKLRNSFTHSRWFGGVKNRLNLFDCENGDRNEFNINWKASLQNLEIFDALENEYAKLQNEELNN